MKSPCVVDGCERPNSARGMCGMHYERCRRRGTLPPLQAKPSIEERFWVKVHKTDGCWLWMACVDETTGYGQFTIRHGQQTGAHRFSYELNVGPIPEGLHIDHLCRVRECVNPDHLEPVTVRENGLRGMGLTGLNSRKTKCNRGHALSGDNLIMTNAGSRRCRECQRLQNQSRYNPDVKRLMAEMVRAAS